MILKKCHLQRRPVQCHSEFCKRKSQELNLSFFNPRQQAGFLRTLMLRTATTGDVMVLIQFFYEDKTKREKLLDAIVSEFPEITSLQYVINSKGNDTIYDQDVICYKGKDHIFEDHGRFEV